MTITKEFSIQKEEENNSRTSRVTADITTAVSSCDASNDMLAVGESMSSFNSNNTTTTATTNNNTNNNNEETCEFSLEPYRKGMISIIRLRIRMSKKR